MKRALVILLLVLAPGVTACGAIFPSPTATATATFTLTPSPTLPPTSTPTLTPEPTATFTPTPTDTPTPVPTNTRTRAERIQNELVYYLIEMQDEANCAFQTQAILSGIDRVDNPRIDVTVALNRLFGFKSPVFGLYQNPQRVSEMYVSEVRILDATHIEVWLGGDPHRSDDRCVNRQIRDQVIDTIRGAVGGGIDVVVWINSVLFDDLMLPG